MARKVKKTSRASPSPPPSRSPAPAASSASPLSHDANHIRSLIISVGDRVPPSLFSADDGIIAYVSEVDSQLSAFGVSGRAYLSAENMGAIHHGSLVSVSIVSPQIGDFPLRNFQEECRRHFGLINVEGDGVGRYFAIAVAFPCKKVSKNKVKLSWDLACTIGHPSVNTPLFVCPFNASQDLEKAKIADALVVAKCKDLYLYPVEKVCNDQSKLVCSTVGNENAIASKDEPSSLHHKAFVDRLSSSVSFIERCADEESNEYLRICVQRSLNGRYLLKANLVAVNALRELCIFTVLGGKLDDSSEVSNNVLDDNIAFSVDLTTKVHFCFESFTVKSQLVNTSRDGSSGNSFRVTNNFVPKLGGLSKESEDLQKYIKLSLFDNNNLQWGKGLLLHGPPGTGKTSLVYSCCENMGAKVFSINGPEIISQYFGESEQELSNILISAKKSSPSVVFIDELDAIAPAIKDGSDELSIGMVSTLSDLFNDIRENDRVLIIAATNRPDSIDRVLRGHGRFGKEIELGVPSPVQRKDILRVLLATVPNSLNDKEIEDLAFKAHGFVGADLAALCNEAKMNALRKYITQKGDLCTQFSKLNLSSGNGCLDNNHELLEAAGCLKVDQEDFQRALMEVRPSAMRDVNIELPKVQWEDVGGQRKVKEQLIKAIQWSQEKFENMGIQRPRGLLMVGPPGCSKTLMARAVAAEAKFSFLAVKGPELYSKWVGESEKAVQSLFAKARANSPAIIFFDEIDGLAVVRGNENDGTSVADRVVSQLLVEMDGLDQREGVTVIAATNRPDKIDRALLRPGRFDMVLAVQPPDIADREEIFGIHIRRMPCSYDVHLKELASLTEGYTGADIKLVCHKAGVAALEESFDNSEVCMRHFKLAISTVQPSPNLSFYHELAAKYERSTAATVGTVAGARVTVIPVSNGSNVRRH